MALRKILPNLGEVFGSGMVAKNMGMERVEIQKEGRPETTRPKIWLRFLCMVIVVVSLLVSHRDGVWASDRLIVQNQLPPPPALSKSLQRTNRLLINAVMALLATFDEVGVLPEEGTSQANQIIHALIQMQSALVKSTNPDLRQFFSEVLSGKLGEGDEEIDRKIFEEGLTSVVVEALVTSPLQPDVWEQPGLVQGFQQFNVTESDWQMVKTVYWRAREAYVKKGLSIHEAYVAWRHQLSP